MLLFNKTRNQRALPAWACSSLGQCARALGGVDSFQGSIKQPKQNVRQLRKTPDLLHQEIDFLLVQNQPFLCISVKLKLTLDFLIACQSLSMQNTMTCYKLSEAILLFLSGWN